MESSNQTLQSGVDSLIRNLLTSSKYHERCGKHNIEYSMITDDPEALKRAFLRCNLAEILSNNTEVREALDRSPCTQTYLVEVLMKSAVKIWQPASQTIAQHEQLTNKHEEDILITS
jgi:hypothetical protein